MCTRVIESQILLSDSAMHHRHIRVTLSLSRTIIQLFQDPLEKNGILSEEEMEILFCNLRVRLRQVHPLCARIPVKANWL